MSSSDGISLSELPLQMQQEFRRIEGRANLARVSAQTIGARAPSGEWWRSHTSSPMALGAGQRKGAVRCKILPKAEE